MNAEVIRKYGKTTIKCRFTKILLVISMNTPWTCTSFSLYAPDELG